MEGEAQGIMEEENSFPIVLFPVPQKCYGLSAPEELYKIIYIAISYLFCYLFHGKIRGYQKLFGLGYAEGNQIIPKREPEDIFKGQHSAAPAGQRRKRCCRRVWERLPGACGKGQSKGRRSGRRIWIHRKKISGIWE